MQIRAHLALDHVDPAVQILESMFQKFPDSPSIAGSSKSVAIKLDQITVEMARNKGDASVIRENLKKISKYYAKWMNLAPALQLRITMQDVISVAETLYVIAKQLNGLGDDVVSFLDTQGREIACHQYWSDAAYVHTLLVDGKVGRLSEKDRILLMIRLARCYSFIAADEAGWEKAKERYENIINAYKLVGPSGTLESAVLEKHRELLDVYLEAGYVYHALGKRGKKFQLDNAFTVFGNILRVTEPNSRPWWFAKYMAIAVLFDRGGPDDVRLAKVGLENLERNYIDFDGGRFGMKERFAGLKQRILLVAGSR